ncbi:hypothetical protein EUZ93_01565 [Wolbachia pipientis]|nr:hypothetical protein [Wolbachia pipientis]
MMAEDLHHKDKTFGDLNRPFTMEELSLALKQSKKSSAPGLDQISLVMLSSLLDKYAEFLDIFNRLFQEGVIPRLWKTSLVIFIPKPHNSGLRPISMLSCVLKVFREDHLF